MLFKQKKIAKHIVYLNYHPQVYSYDSGFLYHAWGMCHHKCLREEYKDNKMKLPIKKIASIQKNINIRPKNKLKFETIKQSDSKE